ncbi:MAG: glycosyltransferase family 2 protein, partial [Bacteroidetes bacterium]
MHAVSIVIPVWNEEKNIPMLVQRIDNSLREHHILYEIIFVDDHSVDKTPEIIKKFSKKYPISFYIKQGNKGKSYSLAEGFEKAQYQTIAMLDADLQYPPEALPEFLKKIQEGANVVVANRKQYKVSTFRKFISSAFKFLFGKLLFGLHHDVQAGFKMFTKEVYETVHFNPSTGWAFDLEFLHRAKQAGYSIKNCDITFEKRQNGESKISFVKASWEIGMNALQ